MQPLLQNMWEVDPDTSLFRIVTVRRFEDLLRSKQLGLLRPIKWEDPFENYLHQVTLQLSDGTPVGLDSLRQDFFGLCWSLTDGSEAAWRLYAPCKNGVRLHCRAGDLFKTLWGAAPQHPELSCYLGKVNYHPVSVILDDLQKPGHAIGQLTNTSGRAQVEALLKKRREYAWEDEVRLIYRSLEDHSSDVWVCPVDPNGLIDCVSLDSRLSVSDAAAAESSFRRLGYTGEVAKSDLYTPTLGTKVILEDS